MCKIIKITILLFFCKNIVAQNTNVFGYVKNLENGESIIGANIYLKNKPNIGIITNNKGFFSLRLINEKLVVISFAGHQSIEINTDTLKNEANNFYLKPTTELDEVQVKSKNNINTDEFGSHKVDIENLKKIPALLGEVDVFKALAIMPGINNGRDGSSGLFVRGGSPEQNLILLDEAQVFNTSHAGGFFSIVNPYTIKSMEVYKGAFPSRYGGKLSSVIDISLKDGNSKNFKHIINLGILNSSVTSEGPIIKDKLSYIFSLRYGNTGFLKLFQNQDPQKNEYETSTFAFYDFTGKLTYNLNKNTSITYSHFKSNDFSKSTNNINNVKDITKLNWGNITNTIRLSHIFGEKLFFRLIYVNSKYANELDINNFLIKNGVISDQFKFINSSYVKDNSLKLRAEYYINNKLDISVGADITNHTSIPYEVKSNIDIFDFKDKNKYTIKLNAVDYAGYFNLNYLINNKHKFSIGSRFVNYNYNNQNFNFSEPRIGLNFQLKHQNYFKLGYSKMNQFVHLLSNNSVGLQSDIWILATDKTPPSKSEQISIGYFHNFPKIGIEASLEIFNKNNSKLIDYNEGTNFLLSKDGDFTDNLVKNGIGRANGIELSLKQVRTKYDAWLSVTLSKSETRFSEINNGAFTPFKYDRPLVISSGINYKLGKKWETSLNFTYMSGSPLTVPVGRYTETNTYQLPILIYAGRFNARMNNYHRLDIGFIKNYIRKGKNRKLGLGIMNVYNKSNPYFYQFKEVNDIMATDLALKQFSLVPILPYINYSWSF